MSRLTLAQWVVLHQLADEGQSATYCSGGPLRTAWSLERRQLARVDHYDDRVGAYFVRTVAGRQLIEQHRGRRP